MIVPMTPLTGFQLLMAPPTSYSKQTRPGEEGASRLKRMSAVSSKQPSVAPSVASSVAELFITNGVAILAQAMVDKKFSSVSDPRKRPL